MTVHEIISHQEHGTIVRIEWINAHTGKSHGKDTVLVPRLELCKWKELECGY